MAYVSETAEKLRRISSMVDVQFKKPLMEAADLISELSLKNQNYRMALSSMYYYNGWIPCSDHTPHEAGSYLVTRTDGVHEWEVQEKYFSQEEIDNLEPCEPIQQGVYEITAWRYKPEPWKGVNYETD